MKKHSLILLFYAVSLALNAQSFDAYIMAGPVVSQIDGDRFGGFDKVGYTTGIGASFPIYGLWSMIVELGYIQKGKGSLEYTDDATYKTVLHYMQLPTMLELQIVDKFAIQTGFTFGLLIGHQFHINGSKTDYDFFEPNTFDFDWAFGGTYKATKHIRVNLRFAYSITTICDLPEGVNAGGNVFQNNYGIYNRSLSLSCMYYF